MIHLSDVVVGTERVRRRTSICDTCHPPSFMFFSYLSYLFFLDSGHRVGSVGMLLIPAQTILE